MITLKAFAKINIALDIVGRRDDGYHLVDMIMQDINLFDILSFEIIEDKKGEVVIELKKPDPNIPLDDKNLITKAIKLMMELYNIKDSVKVILDKRIPAAAGMAGGSTDCAASIKAMNELFSLNLSIDEMKEIGVRLGADVPYCLVGKTKRARGIGEILDDISAMPDNLYYLIAKPEGGISTKEMYEAYDSLLEVNHPNIEKLITAIERKDIAAVKNNMGNVLEPVTRKGVKAIEMIEDIMNRNDAIVSMMTGSGPTVFGIYDDKRKADKIKILLEKELSKEGLKADLFVVGTPEI